MKNHLSIFAVVGIFAVSSILSSGAFASDGTINISGALASSSCTVSGSPSSGSGSAGSGGGDIELDLNTTPARVLRAAGYSGGFKPFTITLSACTPSVVGSVKAGFELGRSIDPASGRLNIDSGSGTATNIQLELRNDDDTVIKVGDSSTEKGATVVANGAVLNYQVGYYASGVPTAGKVSGRVAYSVIYP